MSLGSTMLARRVLSSEVRYETTPDGNSGGYSMMRQFVTVGESLWLEGGSMTWTMAMGFHKLLREGVK